MILILSDALALAQAEAELPRAYVDTTYAEPVDPETGQPVTPIVVNSGGDLQAALNAAADQAGSVGSIVQLQNGAVFTGNFVLPARPGTGWVYVVSSALAHLPPGVRVSPEQAPFMPRIESGNSGPALQTVPGSHHFRLVGVEFTMAQSASLSYGLVFLGDGSSAQNSLSQVPHHLILDRVYIHGRRTVNLRRGVSLQSATSAVIDSHISQVHELAADSQAIGGWNGPGPYKIANNYLEGAAENVMFGGADPFIDQLVPSDIEIRGNHFHKALSWKPGGPGFGGIPWVVKNLLELKNAQRVLVEGNVLEHAWDGWHQGQAVVFTPRNQNGNAPWSVVADVTFRHNRIRHAGGGFNILGRDDTYPSRLTERIVIRDNVLEDISAARWGHNGWLYQIDTTDPNPPPDPPIGPSPNFVTIDHNTGFEDGAVIYAVPVGGAAGGVADHFAFSNNISARAGCGVLGAGRAEGTSTLNAYFPGSRFEKNVIQGAAVPTTCQEEGGPWCGKYPAGTFCPATWGEVGFVEQADLGCLNCRLGVGSPYRGAGADLQDIGADIDGVDEATAGAVSGSPPRVVPVTWRSLVNVTANGNSLTKTSGVDGSWDAGAVSTETLASGAGYVEFTTSDLVTTRALGLSSRSTDASLADIDFAMTIDDSVPSQQTFSVYENGVFKAVCGHLGAGRIAPLRVAVGGSGQVKYYFDGRLCYTSARSPRYPLLVDTSIFTSGATIDNVVIRR